MSKKRFGITTVQRPVRGRNGMSGEGSTASGGVSVSVSGEVPAYDPVDLIPSYDSGKQPTDKNVFTSLRSLKEIDLAIERQELDSKYLRKDRDDRAAGKITFDSAASFLSGSTFGSYAAGQSGGFVNLNGEAEMQSVQARKGVKAGIYAAGKSGAAVDGAGNAEFLSTVIREILRSPRFVDGMFGEGFGLWRDSEGTASMTLDRLTVRQTLAVMELLIEKIRAVGGQLVVSAANGKIKSVQTAGLNYIITFETDNTFVAGDLMRCSVWSGRGLKSYWVEIAAAGMDAVTVPIAEFRGVMPEEGDECVLMGNANNRLRQNMIAISATEDGQPRIDVMDGIKGKSLAGCLRSRLGSLDGIYDSYFPADAQPQGNGLYADNAYLKGTFILSTGEDVKTRFQVMDGLIKSSVEGIRDDMSNGGNCLANASFAAGPSCWETASQSSFFTADSKWIWLNEGPYARKGAHASLYRDGDRTVMLIRNSNIRQLNANMRDIPKMDTNGGRKLPQTVYISFLYRCTAAGTLNISFENVDKTGFAAFDSLTATKAVAVNDRYEQLTFEGLWNGTGDFRLSFTGEIYIYMPLLTVDRVEGLTYRYRTLFEQSDKLVRIAAENFDSDGSVLAKSEIYTTAKAIKLENKYFYEDGRLRNLSGITVDGNGVSLYAAKWCENGQDIISTINLTPGALSINANRINLSGVVTVSQFNTAMNDVNNAINGKANKTDLGGLAYKNIVEMAELGSTVISGGHIITDLIDTEYIYANQARIGGFTIQYGAFMWSYADYFGNESRSLRMGWNQNGNDGVINVKFNAATDGRFGIKSTGAAPGGACIYASSKFSGFSYPAAANTYAGFFDGSVFVSETLISHQCAADEYFVVTSRNSDGTVAASEGGISFDDSVDLDKVRITVKKGLIVGIRLE